MGVHLVVPFLLQIFLFVALLSNEIQTLLDNLFDANFKSIKERVEEAALDLVAAKYYGEKQYFLVLDDFYKNENKNLQKKVHDKNIEKIIRKFLEIWTKTNSNLINRHNGLL